MKEKDLREASNIRTDIQGLEYLIGVLEKAFTLKEACSLVFIFHRPTRYGDLKVDLDMNDPLTDKIILKKIKSLNKEYGRLRARLKTLIE